MPHAQAGVVPNAINGTGSNPLKLKIPEQKQASHNGTFSPPVNGSSNGPLSPPILDATPRKPPMAPPSRPILPVKKSKTLPINFEEKIPARPVTTLLNGKKLFVTKPLKEVHTIQQNNTENGRHLVNRSPSPAYRRTNSSLPVETGSIAELAKRHGSQSSIFTSRSPSPSSYSSMRSSASQYSTCSSNGTFVPLSRSTSMNSTVYNRSITPRRMYPQSYDMGNADFGEMKSKEQAPVVFDANLTFILGCNKQPVRQKFRPIAAHMEEGTTSNYLSNKIDSFLKRTDHVMDEWKRLGHREEPEVKKRLARSKSATNIMIKGFTLFSRSGSRASSVSRSRGISEDRTTVSEMEEVCHKIFDKFSLPKYILRLKSI